MMVVDCALMGLAIVTFAVAVSGFTNAYFLSYPVYFG